MKYLHSIRAFVVLISCFLFFQCSVDRSIYPISKAEYNFLTEFQNLEDVHKLKITDDKEPGEKLMLCLTFVNKESKSVLNNQRVSFYHTSTEGEYEPSNPNDETTARLNGISATNKDGKIYIETILPGDYGSSENNRHIHTTVHGARPEAYDIFFKQFSGGMGKLTNSGNDQMFFADLKKTEDNTLVCFITIEAKNPKAKN